MSPSDKCGTELAERERGTTRTQEKDGGSDEDAAGSAGQRIHGGSQKGKTELK